jgi:hypothetical protein
VREFVRGGYRALEEPTVVTNRGLPLFTAIPGSPRLRPAQDFHATEQRATVPPGPPGPSPNGG